MLVGAEQAARRQRLIALEFEASVELDAALPGFGMVVAEDSYRPVGFAYGYPVTADERWRRTASVRKVLRRADNFHVVTCAVAPGTTNEPEGLRRTPRRTSDLRAGAQLLSASFGGTASQRSRWDSGAVPQL